MPAIVDYGPSHPSPAAIRAAGFVGVARYLPPNWYAITPSERDALLAEGLSITLIYETTANRASQGFAAGQADAIRANLEAGKLGAPLDAAIYYAVDFDVTTQMTLVLDYFRGVNSSSARPVGVYGEADVVDAAHNAGLSHYGWQTTAWSRGRRTTADLFQRLGYVLGNTSDQDDVATGHDANANDWGQWPRPNSEEPDLLQPEHDALMAVAAWTQNITDAIQRQTANAIQDPNAGVLARLDRVETKLNSLTTAGGSIDSEALATRVADLLAQRLAQ